VDPAGTIATIPLVVHPFLIFMTALVVLQSDDAAVSFWRQLAWIGGGIAAFGLLQYLLFPKILLLSEKLYYLDSVTGTFVNRNSAATLFGVAALLIAGLLIRSFQQARREREHSQETDGESGADNRMALFVVFGLFVITMLALFLTKSRGGLISTYIPLTLLAAWFGFSLAPRAPAAVRVGFAAAAIAILLLIFAALGARALFRLEQGGIDDNRWCIYRSALSAIADNPWFGTGFGTFRQVFPIYRNPECGIVGVWDRAHNSFLEGYLGMGLPFAVVVAVVLLYLAYVFVVGYRTRRRFRVVPLIGMATLLLVILHSLVDFSLQIPGVAAYVAAVLGVAASVSVARRHRPAADRD
jgi:O-antigen ligase